jgi:hypothetical protein
LCARSALLRGRSQFRSSRAGADKSSGSSTWGLRDGVLLGLAGPARRPAYGVDVTPAQLETARRCQDRFGITFPLIQAWERIWCGILRPILEPIFRESFPEVGYPPPPNPPDPAPSYYTQLNHALPELQNLLLPAIEQNLTTLGADLASKISLVIKRAGA